MEPKYVILIILNFIEWVILNKLTFMNLSLFLKKSDKKRTTWHERNKWDKLREWPTWTWIWIMVSGSCLPFSLFSCCLLQWHRKSATWSALWCRSPASHSSFGGWKQFLRSWKSLTRLSFSHGWCLYLSNLCVQRWPLWLLWHLSDTDLGYILPWKQPLTWPTPTLKRKAG